jgi:dienelactone hydrolase
MGINLKSFVTDSRHRCNRWRTQKLLGLRNNESINALCALIVTLLIILGPTRSAPGATFDAYAKKGGNYLKAEFRLWFPDMVGLIRGIVLLVPGSNEDGRADIADLKWQAFAVKSRFALLGCFFADKQHNEMFIEQYVNASQGSGMALLRAIADLSKASGHPELRNVPLLLWGMSAGGEFNYEFVNWKPSRVAAFVVNKGGIYYTALVKEGARNTPGLLFVGGKDLASRIEIIRGLFALNRRAGAVWALIEEPNVAHEIGQSQDLAIAFFEDVFVKRLSKSKSSNTYLSLAPVSESSGVVGDLKTKQIKPSRTMTRYHDQTCWFPSTRVAREWLAISQRQSIESK